MMIPAWMNLALWAVSDAVPALRTSWVALDTHLPGWLDTPFLAAAVAGLLTQWAFSWLASRQSRQLNAKTTVALEEIKGGVIQMQATQLTVKAALLELTTRALSVSAPDVGHEPLKSGPPILEPGARGAEDRLDGELRQVLDEMIDVAGGALVLRIAYEQLGSVVSLQNLLYTIYWLRDVGRISWDDAVIGWETELHREAPE
ncbi:hypothetical protein [Micromonospora sp. NPDC005237]|uniref:hypothetical protein n=1 Tax=Micromonospora sp. NPDC005237 TaxID=3155113 RepID=UPI0033A81958